MNIPYKTPRIGIDLGGTKIEIQAIDTDGQTKFALRIKTPQGDYEGTVRAITSLIEQAEASLGRQALVGIGIPGAESLSTGLIKNANSTCLIGHPLRKDLEHLLSRPIKIENDANCFALSEATDGAGAGANVVFGVILGTGVGGGVVVNGRVLSGTNRICGEWGHIPLHPEHKNLPKTQCAEPHYQPSPCYCGRQNCVETWLSGPALSAEFEWLTKTKLAAQQIIDMARHGEATAQALLMRYANRLAQALATVINILDPEVIILGGGLSNMSELYEWVPQFWHDYVFSDQVLTRLSPPQHGDASGVRGAAWLWNGHETIQTP